MEAAYTNNWKQVIKIKPKSRRPFWSLKDIFTSIDKYWRSVFNYIDKVKKTDKQLFDQLKSIIFQGIKWQSMDSATKIETVALAQATVQLFKHRPYGNIIQSTILKFQVVTRFLHNKCLKSVYIHIPDLS